MTQEQKAWWFDNDPSVKMIREHEGNADLMEVRPNRISPSGRYPIFEHLAGVGESLGEAVENAMLLNPWSVTR